MPVTISERPLVAPVEFAILSPLSPIENLNKQSTAQTSFRASGAVYDFASPTQHVNVKKQ
jgi:hypothetical protein